MTSAERRKLAGLLTPEEAEPIIGLKASNIRNLMQAGEMPIGKVIRPTKQNGRKKCKYLIYENLAKQYKESQAIGT